MSARPSCCQACRGTHQFGGDALFGHSAHLRNASLHLCFDVALFSSSKTDSSDALGKISLSIYPFVQLFSVLSVYCKPGTVPGTKYRDEQNRRNDCTHGADLIALFTKKKKKGQVRWWCVPWRKIKQSVRQERQRIVPLTVWSGRPLPGACELRQSLLVAPSALPCSDEMLPCPRSFLHHSQAEQVPLL